MRRRPLSLPIARCYSSSLSPRRACFSFFSCSAGGLSRSHTRSSYLLPPFHAPPAVGDEQPHRLSPRRSCRRCYARLQAPPSGMRKGDRKEQAHRLGLRFSAGILLLHGSEGAVHCVMAAPLRAPPSSTTGDEKGRQEGAGSPPRPAVQRRHSTSPRIGGGRALRDGGTAP